jgi:uncharacterized protein (DUF342 family)
MSDDRLRFVVNCTFPASRLNDEVARVRTELIELGLHGTAELDEAERKLRECIQAQLDTVGGDSVDLVDALLLEGTPSVQCVDAYIEWGGEFLKDGFVVDPDTDAVDYRRRAANPSVEEGQFLARVVPPVPGKPGMDVLGKRIEPRKPKTIRIRAGRYVRGDETSGEYFAERAGRVRYVKNTLSVDDVFEIKGSVGLKTGHIDHPGAVIVGIDVEQDSEVVAVGDIEIRGSVEEALVRSGGNIVVRGGIVGRKTCRIEADGNVEASFIQNCTVEAGGDVIVSQEIHQCTIRARGCVVVKGRIVGGEVSAIEGIDVAQIGSEAGIRTVLSVGKDWVVEAKIAEQKEAIDAATENLKKVSAAIGPLQNRLHQLQGDARAQAMQLVEKAKAMHEAVAKAKEDLEDLYTQLREGWQKLIIVRKILNPDAVLYIGPQNIKVVTVVQGPKKLQLRENGLHFRPLGDKDTLAEHAGSGHH